MKQIAITLAVLAVVGLATTTTAEAGHGYGHGHGHSHRGWGGGYGGSRGTVYHAPSVHIDRRYHADYSHWTPGRGYHTHGHIDYVPHYVPGHRDFRHGNHVHANPRFHHW